MSVKNLFYLAILIAALSACNEIEKSEEKISSAIQPPIPELDIPLDSFEFNVEKGKVIELSNGGTITIPAAALIDEAGVEAKGMAFVNYRELHDAYDIFLAGIPMEYQGSHFSTAGSFEIRLEQNDRPLFLKDSQQVEVKMASFTEGTDYDFYKIDEQSGQWAGLGSNEPEVNAERVKQKRKIKRMRPGLRFPLNRKYMAFNYQAILDVLPNTKEGEMQAEEIKSKLAAYGLGWTQAEIHQRIKWKGQEYHASLMVWKNISRKSFPDWTSGRYGRLETKSKNKYRYHVANKDSTQFFEAELLAIMPLKDLFAFPPEKWINDYKGAMAAIEKEVEYLNTMASVYRSFKINDFGIFNWDRLVKEEEAIPLVAEFEFDREWTSLSAEPVVNYISCDGRCLIKYPKSDWHKFRLMEADDGLLFCLFPDQTFQTFTQAEFAQIDYKEMEKLTGKNYTFQLFHNGKIHSKEDLMQLVQRKRQLSYR